MRELLSASLRSYYTTWKESVFFIILAVLTQDLYIFSNYYSFNLITQFVLLGGSVVAALYFWCASIVATDYAIKQQAVSIFRVLARTLQKMLNVIIVISGYVVLFIVSTYGMHQLNPAVRQSSIGILLIGIPLLLIYVSILFVVPTVLIGTDGLFQSIKKSVLLVWRSHFTVALVLYFALFVLACITWPLSLHGQWLLRHHVKLLFDLGFFVLVSPLVLNFSVLSVQKNRMAPSK